MGAVCSTNIKVHQTIPITNNTSKKNTSTRKKYVLHKCTSTKCFVPPSVVQRYSSPNLSSRNIKPIAESFNGAVLFVDIAGFTAFSEELLKQDTTKGVEELSAHVNAYFKKIIDVIDRFGGGIEKFAGDAIIAIFGSPYEKNISVQEYTMNAVKCGMEIQNNYSTYDANGFTLTLHVCVSAGALLYLHVGGEDESWIHLVTGQPLQDLTAALEQSKMGEVIVTKNAYKYLTDKEFECTQLQTGDWLVNKAKSTKSPYRQAPPQHQIDETAIRKYISKHTLHCLDTFKGQDKYVSESRDLTVLFITLNNSKEMMKTDKFDLKKFQSIVITLQKLLNEYEGTINQILVDEKGTHVVAAFGLPPLYHTNDPLRAVKVALKIKELKVDCSIGIASGKTFAGIIGSETRKDYAILGNVVNLASSLSKMPGEILCDHNTYQQTKNAIFFKNAGPITIKGRKIENIYSPLSAKTSTMPILQIFKYDLVEREDETTVINNILEQLKNKKKTKKLVLIEGNAGMGKSAMAQYILEKAMEYRISCCFGAADETEKSTVFYVWKSVFHCLFSSESGKINESQIIERIKHFIDHKDLVYLPLLNGIVPFVNFEENEHTKKLVGRTREQKIKEFCIQILINNFGEDGFVAVIEDVQWIDSSSRALLNELIKMDSRVAIFLTTRSTSSNYYKELYKDIVWLKLKGFSKDGIRKRISQLTDCNDVNEEILSLVYEKSNGNPLFVQETIISLKESKQVIKNEHGICSLKNSIADIKIADNVRDVIIGRLDTLHPHQNLLVKVASVIGSKFSYNLLASIFPMKDINLKSLIHSNEILSINGDVVKFNNVTVQKVAYDLFLNEQKKDLHAKIADWYERMYSQKDLKQFAPVIASHLYRATSDGQADKQLVSKAVSYLLQAGEYVSNLFALSEGKQFFEKGLALLPNMPDSTSEEKEKKRCLEMNLLIKIANSYFLLGEGTKEERIKMLVRAKSLAKPNEAYQLCICSYRLGLIYLVTGNLDKAMKEAEDMNKFANQDELLMQSHHLLFTFQLVLGKFPDMIYHINKTIELYDEEEHANSAEEFGHDALACAYAHKCWYMWLMGDYVEADVYREKCEEIGLQSNHPESKCHALTLSSLSLVFLGDLKLLKENVKKYFPIVQKYNAKFWEMWFIFMQGLVNFREGLPDEGLQMMEESTNFFIHKRPASFTTLAIIIFTECLLDINRLTEAEKMIIESMRQSEMLQQLTFRSLIYLNKAEYYIIKAKDESIEKQKELYKEVEQLYQKALELTRMQSCPSFELKVLLKLYNFRQIYNECKIGKNIYEMLKKCLSKMKYKEETMEIHNTKEILKNVKKTTIGDETTHDYLESFKTNYNMDTINARVEKSSVENVDDPLTAVYLREFEGQIPSNPFTKSTTINNDSNGDRTDEYLQSFEENYNIDTLNIKGNLAVTDEIQDSLTQAYLKEFEGQIPIAKSSNNLLSTETKEKKDSARSSSSDGTTANYLASFETNYNIDTLNIKAKGVLPEKEQMDTLTSTYLQEFEGQIPRG